MNHGIEENLEPRLLLLFLDLVSKEI